MRNKPEIKQKQDSLQQPKEKEGEKGSWKLNAKIVEYKSLVDEHVKTTKRGNIPDF